MTTVAFIGLGVMGKLMTANLAKKYKVRSYDLNGSGNCRTARKAAEGSDVLITMVPNGNDVRDAVLDALPGLKRGAVVVDMSSSDPAGTLALGKVLNANRIAMVDAPVSGARFKAKDGTLAIMVGGEARDLEEARGALSAMGANVIHVGAVGSGEAAKLCNNLIAGVAAVAVSEAFRIAEGFGVDPKILTDVISKSSGNTWVMQQAHPVPGLVARAASSRDYAPGFMTDLMAKDLGLAVNAARELRIPVIVAPAAQQALRLASSHGLGRKDFTAIYAFLKPSNPDVPV